MEGGVVCFTEERDEAYSEEILCRNRDVVGQLAPLSIKAPGSERLRKGDPYLRTVPITSPQ